MWENLNSIWKVENDGIFWKYFNIIPSTSVLSTIQAIKQSQYQYDIIDSIMKQTNWYQVCAQHFEVEEKNEGVDLTSSNWL